ncbi:Protein LOW PSII ACCUMULATION 1-like, partial [Dillenia turbinata]
MKGNTNTPLTNLSSSSTSDKTVRCRITANHKANKSVEPKSEARFSPPFRSVRIFFYLAFIVSGALGGLIATTLLIGVLSNPSRSAEENKAKRAQLAKLSREEGLSNLKLHIDEKRIIPVSSLRGIACMVILAGPASFITESFRLSEPFTRSLLDRGVCVVPFATGGDSTRFEFEENAEMAMKRKRLAAKYLSMHMDGRVRGSGIGVGVGYPPWNAFLVQLPPVKGVWSVLLDGTDGR